MGMSFPGYAKLWGPAEMLKDVYSPSTYLSWQQRVVLERRGRPWDSEAPCIARVNHGRWVVDCVWCKTGIATDPEWGVAYCAECGARYGAGMVNFPADATEIDRILCQRPERETQNWEPGETLDDLIIENEKRGVM